MWSSDSKKNVHFVAKNSKIEIYREDLKNRDLTRQTSKIAISFDLSPT